MPVARFQMPDGRIARFEVPEGTTPEQAQAMIQAELPKVSPQDTAQPEKPADTQSSLSSAFDAYKNALSGMAKTAMEQHRDAGAGLVRGAGSIGSTLLRPFETKQANEERRNKITEGLASLTGADTDSGAFALGKIVGEVAGTAGAGGALGKGLSMIPQLAKFAPVVQSGGFNLGGAATNSSLANLGMRVAGGAAQGGAAAGMVDPEYAKTGAMIGAVAPPAVLAAGKIGDLGSRGLDSAARKLMNSALKPTIEMHRKGEASRAVQTMLDEGINATPAGVDKLKALVDDINSAIKKAIGDSSATVDKSKVLSALDDTKSAFMKDVSPASALNQIDDVASGFRTHPLVPGNEIPVQLAQDMKIGTYKTLKKSYGELKGAETEARKALARGLKEEIAAAVPEVAPLNARESALINAMKVAERRTLMDLNKNPVGLGPLAPNKAMLAAFLADRSAGLKSLAARGAYNASQTHIPIPILMQEYGLLGAPSVLTTAP